MTSVRIPRKTPEVRVPRLVGLMAVDARETAEARGVLLAAPDRPDFDLTVVDYVVRQYPPPGAEVPRGAVVTVWFDLGEGEGGGGAGVREPRLPQPPSGGLQRELDPPHDPFALLR
ncbi:PASTA domain-containing protein [Streptomyces tauricus]|uniref:PASTA domain-containing protein n=1 Tax=Streptomyces TaxID=1883 RepID=UPI0035716C34